MSTVSEKHFAGGAGLATPGKDGEDLADKLRLLCDDVTALFTTVTQLRTELIELAAKLDDDAGVTDTNYEAGISVDALPTQGLTSA